MILANLNPGERGHVAAIDWDRISAAEGHRLRELGLVEGTNIELPHCGNLSPNDPIAVRIGASIVTVDRVIGIAKGAPA